LTSPALEGDDSKQRALSMEAKSKGWLLAVAFACVGNTAGLWYVATREPARPAAPVAPAVRVDEGQATVLSKALRQIVEERDAERSAAATLGAEPAVAAQPEQAPPASLSSSGPEAKRPDPFARLGEIAEDILTRETRDAAWATSVEQRFASRAEAEGEDVRVQRMGCGSTRCAAEVFIANRQVATKLPGWFGDGTVAFEGKPENDGFSYKAIFARPGHKLRGTL
jgi:hypothetical protein